MIYKLTGSIVLYKNERSVLNKAINSFLSTSLFVKLFLIDNSPSSELADIVDDERVEYFHNPSNPGFGAGHNIAIKKGIIAQSSYHLVLNPDVIFEGGVLQSLLEYMDQNTNIGNLMPRVIYPDGSIQYLCKLLPTPYDWIGRRFNPIKRMVDNRNMRFELRFTQYNKIMDVPYLSGCFMFLRLSCLNHVGLFDEQIFMYGEETDLCRRLNAHGYRTVFYPGVTIIHNFEKGSHKSLLLTYTGIKSAIYYFNKWGWIFDRERVAINREALNKLR